MITVAFLPLGMMYSISVAATRPFAPWNSDRAPATRPAFNFNSANSAFVQVLVEAFRVVAVVGGNELPDTLLSILSCGADFVEASNVSTSDSSPVFIGCVLSMVNTFLTIEFNPSLPELFLAATRSLEQTGNQVLVALVLQGT